MIQSDSITEQITRLNAIVEALKACGSDDERLHILNGCPHVLPFIAATPALKDFIAGSSLLHELVIKSIVAIGQGPMVFQGMDSVPDASEKLCRLLDILLPTERFYKDLGGLVGYHVMVLQLLAEKEGLVSVARGEEKYSKPHGFDLSQETQSVYLAFRKGIESLAEMAEIYPVGGAGDRLQLRDPYTGELLPVAQMELCGKTLLEWLITDLQAREYLHYKVTGKQVQAPIAMMTSHEKRNHERILKICEQKNWFGRMRDGFRFFVQPLVPVVSVEGSWCLSEPFKIMLKPGGHGVIWKLAKDEGIFKWFEEKQRTKVLVRQINNPIAGIDIGLLAFAGFGMQHNKAFGFASCFRLLNAAEGMNILLEKKAGAGYECCITNIEYTDFAVKGIADTPMEPGSSYSAFPANTNILFADLAALEKTAQLCPFPGAIVNMKSVVECLDMQGQMHQIKAGRLESTMQNIADCITDYFPTEITQEQQAQLKTFVTYNHRHRTISVTKKSYTPGQSLLETPEGCYYDLQRHAHELLTKYSQMQLPHLGTADAFTEQGPPFLIYLHPALGPAYHVAAQKIRGGELHQGAELSVEAVEVELEKLILRGSLLIQATHPLGHIDPNGCMQYSEEAGKCVLKNVAVINQGVDWSAPQKWWKGHINRAEALEIILHGNAEFHAENITFNGPLKIEVPSGCRIEAIPRGKTFALVKTKISQPTWFWEYSFGSDNRIQLVKRERRLQSG